MAEDAAEGEDAVVRKVRRSLLVFLYREEKVVEGPTLKPRHKVQEIILADPNVRGAIEARATQRGRSLESARAEAEKMARKLAKGRFDFDDMEKQLGQLIQIGGLTGVMGMLPGAMQAKAAMSKAKIDEGQLKRQEAVILSMTPKERRNPDLIDMSRKKRQQIPRN